MKKNWIIFLLIFLTISIYFISCGWNKSLGPRDSKPTSGMIINWKIENNQLSVATRDSTYIQIYYNNRTNNNEAYRGWTGGNAVINHIYYLPVDYQEISIYEMKLSVFDKNDKGVFQDTTFTFTSTSLSYPHLKVHFINVQQGDAILIQSPDDKNMMIDGGYGRRGTRDWQGGGVPIALNYLENMNITHLDFIVETHRHLDHWGGLQDILDSAITSGPYISPNQTHGYQSGSRMMLGNEVRLDFFNIGFPPSYHGNNINNTSIVLKTTYGDVNFLFTGDIYGDVQDWMINEGFDLSINVLKVPHHGASSNNSSDRIFLDATLNQFAKIAILSFGLNNTYNHPRILNRFNNFYTYGTNKASEIPTGNHNYFDDSGHIVVYSDGKMLFVRTER
ncbi:MAG: MBL fold metallo-hydrolase [Candidatus Cloacimonetes bacterium]|nr:MBL fold metallo-hydrolase [Candidatus Cloacimonadota bacterium]